MTFKSEIREVGSVTLPAYEGTRVMMMPFHLHDVAGTLPDDLARWRQAVVAIVVAWWTPRGRYVSSQRGCDQLPAASGSIRSRMYASTVSFHASRRAGLSGMPSCSYRSITYGKTSSRKRSSNCVLVSFAIASETIAWQGRSRGSCRDLQLLQGPMAPTADARMGTLAAVVPRFLGCQPGFVDVVGKPELLLRFPRRAGVVERGQIDAI